MIETPRLENVVIFIEIIPTCGEVSGEKLVRSIFLDPHPE